MERLARTLEELTALTRELRLGGFCVIDQMGGETPYVGACLSYDGRISDPRTMDCHATPAEALEQLANRMRRAKTEREIGPGV